MRVDILVTVADHKVRPDLAQVRQVDMANTVGAVNETHDAEFLAGCHQCLPGKACPGKGEDSIKHGELGVFALSLDLVDGEAKAAHDLIILDGIGDFNLVNRHRRCL